FKWESVATDHCKFCYCGDEEDGTRANHDFTDGDCVCGRTEQGGQPGPGPGEEVDELSEGLKTFLGDGTGVIYQNGFTKDATVDFVTEAPATGLYGMLSGKFAENPDAANNLKIGVSGGKLNLTDVGVGAVNGYIKVETVSLKKVHIYAELEPKSDASKWNLMTVYDGAGKAIAYIRSDGNKKVGLSLDNNNVYGPTVACSGVISVELTLDLGAGKISGKINGSPIVFAAAEGDTPAVTEGVITATSFGWLNFITADGSKEADTRNISVDNVGIKTEASDVTPAALKEKLVAQLEAKYTALNVEENYTTNGEALKEQYATDKAALQAAETNETILAAYNTAVANLDKVESDATIAKKEAELAAAKTEAIAELKAYNGGAAKYTEEGADGNKTAYDAAIANGESAINGVTIATAGGLQEAKTAVTEALNSAKTVIDGIKNDETLRAEAKAAAKEELAAYKATEIAAIDAEKFPNVIIAINTIKTDTPAEIDEAINLSEIKTLLTNAEGSIDRLITSTEQTFEEFKQAEKDALDEYATQAKQGLDATADAQLIAAIDKAATDGKAAIDAITKEQGRDDVSAAYNAAVAEIENAKSAAKLAKDKAAAKTALADYAKTLEPQIEQDPALVNALELFVTEQQGVIDAETTTAANLAQVKQDCETAITNKVTELKATTYAITVSGADGVTVANVVYGGLVTKLANPANTATQKFVGWYKNAELTVEFSFETEKIYKATTIYAKWQEADVTVTYNVNGKIWNTVKAFSGDAATLETGVYVSGKKFVAWYEGSADGNEYTSLLYTSDAADD
ncbi:MAG: InlB B-repeat-containing protein, partial [Clostridia bacterium]|nr:InlB B-repeat-containing protein [Clostridia bacterium]